MKWVTRERPKTDRIACPWLIRKFIEPDAEIVYVPRDKVLEAAKQVGGKSLDCPCADYTHREGKCTFEVLVEEFGLGDDPALALMAKIIHGADVSEDRDATPQSPGLLAIGEGFFLLELDDHEALARQIPVYDALYRWCREQVKSG